MSGDPNPPQSSTPADEKAPPILPATPPPLVQSSPPAQPTPGRISFGRQLILILLNLCLALFLLDAAASLLNESFGLFLGTRLLSGLSGLIAFFMLLLGLLIYFLMGITPAIPKRIFVPVVLFGPVATLLTIPFLIYFYSLSQLIAWLGAVCQVAIAVGILFYLRGSLKMSWPLFTEDRLGARSFSWLNLIGFISANVFVLLPVLVCYLFLCASLAVSHFGEGFLALRPNGLAVQTRKYVRNDGRTVQLVPMSHIGESSFYQALSESFPTNALILMEGVTDEQHLLTNKITYQRMAKSLGLAEQQREFKPSPVHLIHADVDVGEFRTNTINFLNLVMLIHGRGVTAENLLKVLQYSPSPDFQEQLLDDLLLKRNRHVLGELQSHLPDADYIIIPWGAAHMPGISHGLEKAGFRVADTHYYQAVRFHFFGRKAKPQAQSPSAAKTSIPEISRLAGIQLGYSTQEDVDARWGEGKVVLGGHPNSGRLWRVKGTPWLIYTDAFEYSERGLVVHSLQLKDIDTISVPDPLPPGDGVKVTKTDVWADVEHPGDPPYAKLSSKEFAWLGGLAVGMSRTKAKEFLNQYPQTFKETDDGFSFEANGSHQLVTAKFTTWTASLTFSKDVLSQLDIDAQ
jgi:hypothetical protein